MKHSKRAMYALLLFLYYADSMAVSLHALPVLSNDVAAGARAPVGLDWPALIEVTLRLSVLDCSGSFLSTRYVLTARHCIDGISKENIYVTKPGRYSRRPAEVEGVNKVEKIYPGDEKRLGRESDIALLQLVDSNYHKVRNFPLYHGYVFQPDTPVTVFGSGGEGIEKELTWATMKLKEATAEDMRGAPAYRLSPYAVLPSAPFTLPPAGSAVPGDSGGTVHAYFNSPYLDKSKPVRKAIGIASRGHLGGSARYTIIDGDVVHWIGRHVGMITAPRDGLTMFGVRPIAVTVTEADAGPEAQPITNIALLDEELQTMSTCSPVRQPRGELGCSFNHPDENAVYTIRAYREGDTSYDEVIIINRQSNQAGAKGEGLEVELN